MLAEFGLFHVFWTIIWIFFLIAFLWILISIITDLFRSEDLGGWAKGIWTFCLIVFPFIGALIYLIARGAGMHDREMKSYSRQRQAMQEAAQMVTGTATVAEQLEALNSLKEKGVLTEEEFATQKAKLLA